jgi:hypothetical protein
MGVTPRGPLHISPQSGPIPGFQSRKSPRVGPTQWYTSGGPIGGSPPLGSLHFFPYRGLLSGVPPMVLPRDYLQHWVPLGWSTIEGPLQGAPYSMSQVEGPIHGSHLKRPVQVVHPNGSNQWGPFLGVSSMSSHPGGSRVGLP